MRPTRNDVDAWSESVVARPWLPLTTPVLQRGSVLRAPARSGAIDAAEANLDVRLPSSYRSFLELTDGAYADWEQPMAELSGPRLGSTDPWVGLLPVGEVRQAR